MTRTTILKCFILVYPFFLVFYPLPLNGNNNPINEISPDRASKTTKFSNPNTLEEEFFDILKRIDENLYLESVQSESRMIIINSRGKIRELKMKNWGEGDSKSFSEYLSPAREAGTKMLKVDKNLWTYSPSSDRIIHIAGHLLRQSIMGSDLSYEDSMEDSRLESNYHCTKIEKYQDEKIGETLILSLEGKTDNLAYPTRKLWVDPVKNIPFRQELFAKSGKLLKTMTTLKVERIQNRWYTTEVLYKDELKSGEGTRFIMDKIVINPKIPANLFSRKSLGR